MNTGQRSETGQWASVGNLRITERTPAKTGEQSLAGKFGERPKNGQGQAGF